MPLDAITAREEGDALSADCTGIRRNDNFGASATRDGSSERVCRERHSLTEDDFTDSTGAFHAVEVILNDGVVDTGDDIFLSLACGNGFVDDFGHEDGAVLSQGASARSASSDLTEVTNVFDALEAFALFFDE